MRVIFIKSLYVPTVRLSTYCGAWKFFLAVSFNVSASKGIHCESSVCIVEFVFCGGCHVFRWFVWLVGWLVVALAIWPQWQIAQVTQWFFYLFFIFFYFPLFHKRCRACFLPGKELKTHRITTLKRVSTYQITHSRIVIYPVCHLLDNPRKPLQNKA